MSGDAREVRLAQNEALARDVNERVEDVAASWYGELEALEFVCECSLEDCSERIHLRQNEYREVRSSPRWFAVREPHVDPEIERVVKPIGDAVIVEKIGVGKDVAEETAP